MATEESPVPEESAELVARLQAEIKRVTFKGAEASATAANLAHLVHLRQNLSVLVENLREALRRTFDGCMCLYKKTARSSVSALLSAAFPRLELRIKIW